MPEHISPEDQAKAAAHYGALAAQVLALTKPTDHERIGSLIDGLLDELLAAQDWMDESGFETLDAVLSAKAYWATTYARQGDDDCGPNRRSS